jgi:hypothetical protein
MNKHKIRVLHPKYAAFVYVFGILFFLFIASVGLSLTLPVRLQWFLLLPFWIWFFYMALIGLELFLHKNTNVEVDQNTETVIVKNKGDAMVYQYDELSYRDSSILRVIRIYKRSNNNVLAIFDYDIYRASRLAAWAREYLVDTKGRRIAWKDRTEEIPVQIKNDEPKKTSILQLLLPSIIVFIVGLFSFFYFLHLRLDYEHILTAGTHINAMIQDKQEEHGYKYTFFWVYYDYFANGSEHHGKGQVSYEQYENLSVGDSIEISYIPISDNKLKSGPTMYNPTSMWLVLLPPSMLIGLGFLSLHYRIRINKPKRNK